jgi:putative SOS response-associated peptidase YedK
MFFAGLWAGDTFAVLTTDATGDLCKVHHRRPLALGVEESREWIETTPQSEGSLVAKQIPADEIVFYPVNSRVSSSPHDGPDLISEVQPTPVPQAELDLFRNSA